MGAAPGSEPAGRRILVPSRAAHLASTGQFYWPRLGSSIGHGWAVLLSATGQIPLAIDRLLCDRCEMVFKRP